MSTPAPRARPAAAGVSLVIAMLLLALAVVGVHELLVDQHWSSGSSWLGSLSRSLDGLAPGTGITALAVLVALVGLWLLVVAIAPARRTHQRTPVDDGDVWISRRAVSRLAVQAAERTPGVDSARATLSRRSLLVRATLATADEPPPSASAPP